MTEEIPESVANLKREGTLRESFDWVFAQLALPEPEMESCPCLGAFGMLEWASQHPSEFYKLAASLLAKEKTDATGSFERKINSHLERIEAHGTRLLEGLLQDGAEEHGGEPEVSPEDSKGSSNEQDDPPNNS